MPKVKNTQPIVHEGKRIEAGQTIEVSAEIIDLNPGLFEPVKEKPAKGGDDDK